MSIRKRTWETTDGPKTAWVVDYKDQARKRRLKTFDRQKDARAWWEGHAAHEIKQGTHTPESKSITVNEAADIWLRYLEVEGRERSTLAQYRTNVDLHIAPRIGGVKLANLTTPRVQKFRDDLLANLSRVLAAKVLTALKSLLKHAMTTGHVAQNVASPVTITTTKRQKLKSRLRVGVDIPTPSEVTDIINAASDRWRPLIVTAAFTGMRLSELRGLTWGHIDFKAGVIHVRQRADKWGTIGPVKSEAGERDVPLLPVVKNTLREWKLRCPAGDLNLVFPSNTGSVHLQANIYRRGFGDAQKRCGLVDEEGRQCYSVHAFRHFFASWLIANNFPAKRIQNWIGHSSIVMTYDTYGHLFPADDEADAARLARLQQTLIRA